MKPFDVLTLGEATASLMAQVVDTVGAGDGFAVGGSVVRWRACRWLRLRGNAIGARVVQFVGGG